MSYEMIFTLTVFNQTPQDFHNDGPLIIWSTCNNMQQNNITIVEVTKTKNPEAILAQVNDDIEKYFI